MNSKTDSIQRIAAEIIAVMTAGYIANGYETLDAVNKARAAVIHLLANLDSDVGAGLAFGLMMMNFTIEERGNGQN